MVEHNQLWIAYVKIAIVVTLYWIVSITMVFLNKLILSGSAYSLDTPLFITWFQCAVTLGVTICGNVTTANIRRESGFGSSASSPYKRGKSGATSPPIRFRLKTARAILPLTIVFVAMITFNNLCLKHVGVAFYFVGRSLTTVFNVSLTWIILGRRTSAQAIACCGAIVFGFLLGVDQEQLIGSLSLTGILYGILASLFVSLNSILTVNGLAAVNGSIWSLTYYNNAIACVLFLPLILVANEANQLASSAAAPVLRDHVFWLLMFATGLCGFAIGYVTNLQIQYTSPLTHNISGTAKACAQTVLATFVYDERKTLTWWTSNLVVLFASAAYTRVKQLEMSKANSPGAAADKSAKGVNRRHLDNHSPSRSSSKDRDPRDDDKAIGDHPYQQQHMNDDDEHDRVPLISIQREEAQKEHHHHQNMEKPSK